MPLSPSDQAILTMERHGQSIVRLPGDMGGGDASAFNYGLWCGGCQEMLGRLGVFQLREREHIAPYPHRIAHCTHCHHTTFVREESGRRAEIVHLKPPALMGGVCVLCSPATAKEAPRVQLVEGQDKAAPIGTLSVDALKRANRVGG